MLIKPRYYQEEAIQAPFDYFTENKGNPVIAMPTGTGKSVVIGGFVQRVFDTYANQRVIVATHVKELIEQNHEKMLKMWPTAPAGIYSAGIGRRDIDTPIIFGGIQSMANRARDFGHIDLMLVDEAHLVSPDSNTRYQKFFNELALTNPYLKAIGLTATAYRLGQGMITDDGLFTDICYDLTSLENFNRLIKEGWLAPLIPKPTNTVIDVNGVGTRNGDFIQSQLEAVTNQDKLTWAALQELISLGQDRRHWLIFGTGIKHCEKIKQMLEYCTIPCGIVHSKIEHDREEEINKFKNGEYRALVNNDVLTTGFDFNGIDLIGVLRATMSPGLWVQILGRGTRPVYAPGFDLDDLAQRLLAIQHSIKQNCLVLDFARNTQRLGPINDPVIPKKKGKGGGGVAPIRICEQCDTYLHASIRTCPHCGYVFPVQVKFGVFSSNDKLIVDDTPVVEDFKVSNVTYQLHKKKDRPDTIRVSYFCGLRRFNNYICIDHGGAAKRRSLDWWKDASITGRLPNSIEEALTMTDELKEPKSIRVWVNKKMPDILAYEYC